MAPCGDRALLIAMPIRFYYRPQCGLCSELEPTLQRIAAQYHAAITRINIDEDRVAWQRYWDRIPVIEIDGQPTLYEPIAPDMLRAAIRRATKS